MAKMIKTEYGYATPQEAEMDARLDKWYKDKKRRAKQQSKGKHSQDESKRSIGESNRY